MDDRKDPFSWRIDPLKGSGKNDDDKQSDSWVSWINGWKSMGDWLDLSQWYDSCFTTGCFVLLVAIVVVSSFIAGLFVGRK